MLTLIQLCFLLLPLGEPDGFASADVVVSSTGTELSIKCGSQRKDNRSSDLREFAFQLSLAVARAHNTGSNGHHRKDFCITSKTYPDADGIVLIPPLSVKHQLNL